MSSGISFTCDSCGREVFSCNIVNGMKFCAKCYQEIFGNQQNKENSELLVNSLAEKDKQIAELKEQLRSQPAEIVEKINGEIYTRMVVECKETKYTDINLILNTILKEYGEKNDSRRTKSRSKETRLQHYQNTRES